MQAGTGERPRELRWYHAAGMLFGDWGTSRLYVLGLAFTMLRHEASPHAEELNSTEHNHVARDPGVAEAYDSAPIGYIVFGEDGVIHEVKLTDSMEQAHEMQLLYYLYYLKRWKGVEGLRGQIDYPKLRETKTEGSRGRSAKMRRALRKAASRARSRT